MMSPNNALKTTFMMNKNNYCYDVMSFELENAGATCQRLMDIVFSIQIGRNLEVYIEDMFVKSPYEWKH